MFFFITHVVILGEGFVSFSFLSMRFQYGINVRIKDPFIIGVLEKKESNDDSVMTSHNVFGMLNIF